MDAKNRLIKTDTLDRTAVKPILAAFLSAGIGTLIAMTAGTAAAYGLSRFGSGANLPFALVQMRLFPPMAVMTPVMIKWAVLNFTDTRAGAGAGLRYRDPALRLLADENLRRRQAPRD